VRHDREDFALMGKERDANGGIRRAASPCADERHDDLYFNANRKEICVIKATPRQPLSPPAKQEPNMLL